MHIERVALACDLRPCYLLRGDDNLIGREFSRAFAWQPGTPVLLVTGSVSFMSALDSAASLLVIPLIQQDFATSVAAVQWIALAYLLTVSGLLLPVGQLGDLWGLRRVYLVGISVFGISSILCALAPTIESLIIFRVFEAVGAAMTIAAAPALLTQSFSPEQRGHVLGLQLTMTYVGLVAGPFIGGFVADWWSWRGVFWINGLVGVPLFMFALRILPGLTGSWRGRFDFSGAVILMAAVLLLMLAVTAVGELNIIAGWRAFIRAVVVITGLLLGYVFVLRQRKLEQARLQPLLSPRLFGNRSFSLSAAIALVGYTCEFFITFLMPFYVIQIMGLSPSQAGLIFMVKAIVMMVTAPVAGIMSDRRGPRSLTMTAMLAYIGAFVVQSRLSATAGVAEVTLLLILSGLAAGLFVSPNNSAMIGAAPSEMRGAASAMVGMVRNFGMVFGTAFSGALVGLRPESLLSGFHLAMGVGAIIALGGLALGALQASKVGD
jgi:EmrB/QacA subfamily drug resistance transporter